MKKLMLGAAFTLSAPIWVPVGAFLFFFWLVGDILTDAFNSYIKPGE